MAGFMMQKGTIIVCGDVSDGVADSMYEGTILVGGGMGELGADAVEADLTADELTTLSATLDRLSLDGPDAKTFRKLISGRKLWNFSRADLEIWKSAL